jgi:TonB dependent receptor-like, beta-barrel/Carboxypeptidase regulatory-like domain
MPRLSLLLLLLTTSGVFVPRTACPQALTGTLIGTVRDEVGGVLPGAHVRISSDALIGGPLTRDIDERGQLRFLALPPGLYQVEIDMPGFSAYREQGVAIGIGATIERTVVLKVAGVAESIVVEGAGSRIEARGSGLETRFDQEYIRAIPSRRYSMFDFIKAAPGVSPTSPSSGTSNSVSVLGSGVNENAFLLDGTNFTCPCSGGAVAEPGIDVIQEVQVQSVGASAEFGNIQGAVFNIVTKQGSNLFAYDASYYGQAGSLTSQPVRLACMNCSQPETGYERARYRDFTTNLGGPIVRDRIWFFGAYQYLRDYDSQPGTDPKFPRAYQQDKVFGKLTWQLAPRLRLQQSYHNEFWVNPERPTLVTPFEVTLRPHASVPTTTFGQLTYTASSHTLWDARVGRFVNAQENDPSTGNRSIPNHFDRTIGLSSGGPQQFGTLTLIRTTAKATLTHDRSGLWGADHEWKVGLQVEKGEHNALSIIPSGTRFVDDNGRPFQAISRDPATPGGQFVTAGAFLSEALTIGDRLTVNAGLRFDHSRAISQDLRARDVDGRETGEVVRGLGTLYTWNVWSPRLGVTTKLTGDGRTMLRASFGRFHQGVLTGDLGAIHPGQTPTTTTAFDATTGGYTRLVSVVDPKVNVRLDPETRSPLTDEYSASADREIGRRLAMTLAYVGKTGRQYIGWTDTGGQYREETRTLADGRAIPVFVLTNGTANRRFLLTNPDGYSLVYNGLVAAIERRRADGWQAFASYTFSKTHGLQVSSGGAAAEPQSSSGGTFGRDPNSLTNASGRLPNDRPHMFRGAASVDLPRVGFVVAANVQHVSGKPWAATAQVALPQGDQRILLEPRGTRRLSSQTLLDLRLSRTVPCGSMGRLQLNLDVLNALNEKAEEALATDNLFSTNFGQPTVFTDPRRVMVSARVNLGPR